jgi:sugar phosphate isomerase/epimerase
MQIQIFAAHWGNNELEPQVFIDRVKAAGFDGIEMSLPLDVAAARRMDRRIADAGLGLIVAQWETVFHRTLRHKRRWPNCCTTPAPPSRCT